MRQVSVGTAIKLLHVFWPDFVEVDGSVYLPWAKPEKTSDPEHGVDFTEMEASMNHTHIIDLFKHKADRQPEDENDDRFYDNEHPDFLMLCQLGKTLAKMWFLRLRADFPNYEFRVYYTQEDNPIVRFHRIRSDESIWLDEARYPTDVDQGKIIVYDTRYGTAQ